LYLKNSISVIANAVKASPLHPCGRVTIVPRKGRGIKLNIKNA